MTYGNGASRGDRNRNARLARLSELVPLTLNYWMNNTPKTALIKPDEDPSGCMTLHTFSEDFVCTRQGEDIHLGHLVIPTGDNPEEDEEEYCTFCGRPLDSLGMCPADCEEEDDDEEDD